MNEQAVSSGIPGLDEDLQGLRPGDNVVFQVDNLRGYVIADPQARKAICFLA